MFGKQSSLENSDEGILIDDYLDWTKEEGVPIVEDFGVDLLAVETKPWARMGTHGAFAHVKGRGDFLSIFVIDIQPGSKTEPQKHLFEEVIYVLSGRGSTTVEADDGNKHTFEWGPKSLFALPLNARYQHFNGSGQEPARMASTNNLPGVLNTFHNREFVSTIRSTFPSGRAPPSSSAARGTSSPSARGATSGRPISCPIWASSS